MSGTSVSGLTTKGGCSRERRSFIDFYFRWTSQCAEDVFHAFLEKTLPRNLVQPAIEKQEVFCQRKHTREVHLFDTRNFACAQSEGEEGSGLSLNANGSGTFDYVDYVYYDDNRTSLSNFSAYDELVFQDDRDINSSTSLTFDLESEDYHCLDMVMVGRELAGITVLKCNSAEGDPGHLTKCCPRFVKQQKRQQLTWDFPGISCLTLLSPAAPTFHKENKYKG